MGKKPLQVVMVLFGLGAAGSGVGAMMGLDNPTYAALGLPVSHVLDNNLRFYAGIWMGLGLAALWLVPTIERQTALFRAIWGALFLGGVGRACSMLSLGSPPPEFIAYAAIELLLSPLMIYWHARVTRNTT